MSNEKCRWGILGTAGIARKNWQAIRNSGNGQLVAVGSRTVERAKEYIAENQSQIPHDPPPRPIADYDAMIASEDIDALYIPLPTGVRKDYVLKAAAAGKHVLCEKPVAINCAELALMVTAAKANKVTFMEAMLVTFLPNYQQIKKQLKALGKIRKYSASFCQFSSRYPAYLRGENPNTFNLNFGNGALMDIGIYPLYLAIDLFG